MRAFDNWNSYLNNDRKLLHGKIRFCKRGTTDNVAVYDRDGQPVRNPEFTDNLGRTEYQVFVDDDVTAYFYQYIGTGDMMQWQGEDYDPSRWAYQYSSDDISPLSSLDLKADSAPGVATMADLRAVDPDIVPTVNDAKLMWLYGYYEAGDTSPVLYVWNSASLDVDDGGACIKANGVSGKGRWILASREYIFDVRHFGIFGQSDKYSTDYSYTSQITNCATYCCNEGLNAWFPDVSGAMAYYMLDGTNTFAITGDIYCSDAVRFVCKSGTSGTAISCNELHKAAPYLFDSSVQTGTATLTCDHINISWVGGNVTGDARVGWVIDKPDYARTITGKEVHFEVNGHPSLILDDCQITANKVITDIVTIQNSVLKTEWFADDYLWGKLNSYNNTILLNNCKDANTYIILKNKQGEANYGDLGEQQIDADVLAGGTIENCYGKVRFVSHGSTEMHNVTLDLADMTAADSLNCVDSWLTFPADTVLGSMQLRRGSVGYSGTTSRSLQLLSASYISDANVSLPVSTLGTSLELARCKIYSPVTAGNVVLTSNDIYAEISQTDVSGTIVVNCVGNTFHCLPGTSTAARHYVHAGTANSKVVGVWRNNGSSYDTVHWIRLDRTNLLVNDNDHEYTYAGNAEPYLAKWSGRNRPMEFYLYSGYWTGTQPGTGVFATTTIPFLFYNTRTRAVTAVNRYHYWKMFTVGRGFLARSGHISSIDLTIGFAEGDYDDHENGQVPIVWTWGCEMNYLSSVPYGRPQCVSLDGSGEADYNCSFELPNTNHNSQFSYGIHVGHYPSHDWDNDAIQSRYARYPDEAGKAWIFVFVDPDFTSGTNPSPVVAI